VTVKGSLLYPLKTPLVYLLPSYQARKVVMPQRIRILILTDNYSVEFISLESIEYANVTFNESLGLNTLSSGSINFETKWIKDSRE
jgi:hypothetical protein